VYPLPSSFAPSAYDGVTAIGTVDGKPLLTKIITRLFYRCCYVMADGYLTQRCWACGLETGLRLSLTPKDLTINRYATGAQMSFAAPVVAQANLLGIGWVDGYWHLRSPA
jgi:hypothetical protein